MTNPRGGEGVPMRWGWLVPLLLVLAPFGSASDALSAQEERGRQIYLKGLSDQEIIAAYGSDNVEVSASVMPCVNCHGFDGKGRPEGGIIPSNITWHELTKPYGKEHLNGRKSGAYDEAALKRAITMGLDAAGNRLDPTMPRYRMTLGEMADLVAYVKRLGTHRDPGIADAVLKIGVVLPPDAMGAFPQAVEQVLRAGVAELNARGGIYNRTLELVFQKPTGQLAPAYHQLIADHAPFALLASFMAGEEAAIAALLAKNNVPLIGSYSLQPQVGFPLNRQVFYLASGLTQQSQALASFVHGQLGVKPKTSILFPDDPRWEEVATDLARYCKALGWPLETRITRDANTSLLVGELARNKVEAIFFLGNSRDAEVFLEKAQEQRWFPLFLIPNGRGHFEGIDAQAQVFTTLSGLPPAQTDQAFRDYLQLVEKYALSTAQYDAQAQALAALKLLTECATQIGRDLSREKLIASLERLDRFETGLTPKLSFGPNRRIGARGAYILRLDPQKQAWIAATDWIELDPL